jgi:hypothetical protein
LSEDPGIVCVLTNFLPYGRKPSRDRRFQAYNPFVPVKTGLAEDVSGVGLYEAVRLSQAKTSPVEGDVVDEPNLEIKLSS